MKYRQINKEVCCTGVPPPTGFDNSIGYPAGLVLIVGFA